MPERFAHAHRDDERDESRAAPRPNARLQVVRAQAADRVAERHQHQRDQQIAEQRESSSSNQSGNATPDELHAQPADGA